MKKLMMTAAVAAIVGGASAACVEIPESAAGQVDLVWDISMKVKTLGAKKTTCKTKVECGEDTKGTIYYLDSATRSVKGIMWICEYACEDSVTYVSLWDAKNKEALIAAPREGAEGQEVDAAYAEMMVFGKKANKVAATFNFVGVNAAGEDGIDVLASGVNGKISSKTEKCGDGYCFLKSMSGNVAGNILPITPYAKVGEEIIEIEKDGLCGDKTIINDCVDVVEPATVLYTTLCEVCAGFDGWCAAEECAIELDGMVPAVGTWSMKWNKKLSKGAKQISSIVPAYAL